MKILKIAALCLSLFLAATLAHSKFDNPGMFDTFIQALRSISTSILPSVDNTYDLGSLTHRLKDAHLGGTAYIADLSVGTAYIADLSVGSGGYGLPNFGFTYNAMVAEDDFLLGFRAPVAITITGVHGVLADGTDIVGMIYICDGTNDLNDPLDIPTDCDACDGSDITFDGGLDSDVALNGTVACGEGDWPAWVTTSVDGPGFFSVAVTYTVD